jgi:hypothetical protein
MGAAARAENRAAGERLAVIGELDLLRLRQVGERETDTQEAVTAEVAAALGITQALAASYLYYSRAMRARLPRVGTLLQAGEIEYRMFQTIVYRTDLITDPDVRAAALPGRGDAGAGCGGDSRDRRPCHPRRHVTDPCLDDRKPCAGPGRAGGRTRPYGH